LLLGGGVLLVSGSAFAGVIVRHRAHHKTRRSVAHVLEVLGAHEQTCEAGCRYRAPDVARAIRIKYRQTQRRYYVWTHVQAVKDSRSFQRVELNQGPQRTVFRVVTPSAHEISDLELQTKLKHESLLDHLEIVITIDAPTPSNGSLTNVYVGAEARASGMIGWFEGAIRSSLAANARAIFDNIES
jgi:hypothetical protein